MYGIIFQIPCNAIVQKLGIKKSVVIGNLLWVLGFVFCIVAPNIFYIIVADILFAIGNVLKQLTEPEILLYALKEEKMEDKFNQLEGRGVGIYYYIETITSILAGFLFIINPYIPFVLGTMLSILSFIISCRFDDIKVTIQQNYTTFKEHWTSIKHSIRGVMNKKRLQALMLYSAVFTGIIVVNRCYYKNFLSNLGMDTGQFGVIFALLTIIQGIACQRQYIIERKTKNKTLTWAALSFTATLAIIGLLGISGLTNAALISLIVLLLVIQKIIEGTYQISIRRYMVNFTTPSTITNVLTANNLFNNLGTSLILLFGSFVLDHLDMSYGYMVVGVLGFIIMGLILMFMKNRVGLRPEQYKEYLEDEV
jgi:MFS family permease